MCFSSEISITAAVILLPAGAAAVSRAFGTDRRYLPIALLPLMFGIQQAFEAGVWIASDYSSEDWVNRFSLGYMFFSWLAWPVWVPVSVYFLESDSRKPLFLGFSIIGAMLGSAQYFPYIAHQDWLVVEILPRAIRYAGTELFDAIIGREGTYTIYLSLIIGPLLLSSLARLRIFGLLVAMVVAVTYLFFAYAYVSFFCFGGALMSLYLVWLIFTPNSLRESAAIVS